MSAKAKFTVLALIAIPGLAHARESVPDLTGASAAEFRAHLGRVVSLRGRLEQGVQGAWLSGATRPDVAFYVIADVSHGTYSWSGPWQRLEHRPVRIIGELKFQSFGRSHVQHPPDYFYMVVQRTKIEVLDSK